MITAPDPKSNGILTCLQEQRDGAMEACAMLRGELALRDSKIQELNNKIAELNEVIATAMKAQEDARSNVTPIEAAHA